MQYLYQIFKWKSTLTSAKPYIFSPSKDLRRVCFKAGQTWCRFASDMLTDFRTSLDSSHSGLCRSATALVRSDSPLTHQCCKFQTILCEAQIKLLFLSNLSLHEHKTTIDHKIKIHSTKYKHSAIITNHHWPHFKHTKPIIQFDSRGQIDEVKYSKGSDL